MSEIDGSWEARADAKTFDSFEQGPLDTEKLEQSGEFYHQLDGGRPELEREVGHAALAGYEDIPSEPLDAGEVTDVWDRRNEPEGTLDTQGHDGRELNEDGDAEEEIYDIWDRRNETSGSINLRKFGL